MNKPKVIMHNTVSLDGAVNGFDVDMELHYGIAGTYRADVHLIGSDTILAGIKLYSAEIPPEEKADYAKPEKVAGLPLWVIPDTRGRLQGLLHYLRRTEYCRDVAILIAENTSRRYRDYLQERNYDCFVCGKRRVDYREALDVLRDKYGTQSVMVDAGPTLNAILLKKGLIDEIHLLVAPSLVGEKQPKIFSRLHLKNKNIDLELLECRKASDNTALLSYRVSRKK